jgi:ribosomal protein S18 acetylase RimI-like enzyme
MYVVPALHRRGVGAALLRAVIEHARTRIAVVHLTVLHANTAAKALYRQFGFVPYGIELRALRHQGADHDDELMALDLQNGL